MPRAQWMWNHTWTRTATTITKLPPPSHGLWLPRRKICTEQCSWGGDRLEAFDPSWNKCTSSPLNQSMQPMSNENESEASNNTFASDNNGTFFPCWNVPNEFSSCMNGILCFLLTKLNPLDRVPVADNGGHSSRNRRDSAPVLFYSEDSKLSKKMRVGSISHVF